MASTGLPGLHDLWEPVRWGFPKPDECFVDERGEIKQTSMDVRDLPQHHPNRCRQYLIVRPKKGYEIGDKQ